MLVYVVTRSPDLTPLVCFTWGHIRDMAYRQMSQSRELRQRIYWPCKGKYRIYQKGFFFWDCRMEVIL